MLRRYEFHVYAGGDDGHAAEADILHRYFQSEGSAKAHGGRLARNRRGPVDIAEQGDGPWEDRYITTAQPSAFHAKGYSFGRLD